jgi:hypothetical protein
MEFGVKIPQVFDGYSARASLRELPGGIGNLKRYSGLRKLGEKGDCGNHGIGPQILNLGSWIFSEEDTSLTTVIYEEGAQ